jgi:hypothetical protein
MVKNGTFLHIFAHFVHTFCTNFDAKMPILGAIRIGRILGKCQFGGFLASRGSKTHIFARTRKFAHRRGQKRPKNAKKTHFFVIFAKKCKKTRKKHPFLAHFWPPDPQNPENWCFRRAQSVQKCTKMALLALFGQKWVKNGLKNGSKNGKKRHFLKM